MGLALQVLMFKPSAVLVVMQAAAHGPSCQAGTPGDVAQCSGRLAGQSSHLLRSISICPARNLYPYPASGQHCHGRPKGAGAWL